MQKGQKTLNKTIADARKLTENFRGVSLDITVMKKNGYKPFRAVFVHEGKKYSLGYHENPQEAAQAYNKMAKKAFGSEKAAKAKGRWNVIS